MMQPVVLQALAELTRELDPYGLVPDRHRFTRPLLGWEFCNLTPGCTLRAGHSGVCKVAKGL